MTLIDQDSTVVYEVALNDHPLVVGEDDDRSDEELIGEVEERTSVADDLDFPDWSVFVSDPPGEEALRYVNTKSRINVLVRYNEMEAHNKKNRDVFDEVEDRIEIEGVDMERMAMSCPGPTHIDDFDRHIHLDLTD